MLSGSFRLSRLRFGTRPSHDVTEARREFGHIYRRAVCIVQHFNVISCLDQLLYNYK